ncbi:MAG: 3-deoxy-7-phosphoheptulonate synthase, partial [Acidobacteria bacterium]
MIVVMAVSAVEAEIQQVVRAIEAQSLHALIMPGGERVAIG